MKNTRFWLLGLVPLLVLWFAANQLIDPQIAADLQERVAQALSGKGAGWAKVTVAGRDVRILSTAPDAGAKGDALAVAASVDGVRRVSDDVDVLAVQDPYTLRAERKAGTLTIEGYVPSEALRAHVLSEAARIAPGAKVEAKLNVAGGAPKNFSEILNFALGQLGKLSEGDASISNTTLAISGRAADLAGYSAFVAAMKSVPKGIVIGTANVIPPKVTPYIWSAEKAADSLVMTGYAPDGQTQEANAAAAKAKFPDLKIVDQQILALGQSDLYSRAVQSILDALSRLKSGKGALSGDVITLSGAAGDDAALAALNDLLKAASDAGLKVESSIAAPSPPKVEPPPPPPDVKADADKPRSPSEVVVKTPEPKTEAAQDCGVKVESAVKGRMVQFARSSAEIGSESAGLLADIGSALKACGKVAIAVEGHTDSEGQEDNNKRLSEARAAAVRAALVGQGVEPGRIASSGFGWSRPLVPNTTKDNLAKNRRVEFVIR